MISGYIQLYTVNTPPLLTLMEAEDNLPRRRYFCSLRFVLLVSADVRGAGTRDEPPRTSAWEATLKIACFILFSVNFSKVRLQLIKDKNEMRQELGQSYLQAFHH